MTDVEDDFLIVSKDDPSTNASGTALRHSTKDGISYEALESKNVSSGDKSQSQGKRLVKLPIERPDFPEDRNDQEALNSFFTWAGYQEHLASKTAYSLITEGGNGASSWARDSKNVDDIVCSAISCNARQVYAAKASWCQGPAVDPSRHILNSAVPYIESFITDKDILDFWKGQDPKIPCSVPPCCQDVEEMFLTSYSGREGETLDDEVVVWDVTPLKDKIKEAKVRGDR